MRVIIPLAGLFFNILLQIISFKIILNKSLLKSICFGFLSGGVVFLIVEYLFNDKIGHVICNVVIYIFLSYNYFHFINLGETARRIRLLIELKESTDGLAINEVLERYNSKEIIRRRLDRLTKNGQVVSKSGRFYIDKPVMLIAAKALSCLRIFLLAGRI